MVANAVPRTAAEDGALMGMKAICHYMDKSEPTILSYIRIRDFPARKLGGEWVSDAELIAEWRAAQIRSAENPSTKKIPKKPKKTKK